MNIINTIFASLLKPVEFFKKDAQKKTNFGDALLYFVILLIFYSILNTSMAVLLQSFVQDTSLLMFSNLKIDTPIKFILGISWSILGTFIFLFISMGIIHFFVILLKGHGTYMDTLKADIFASTPVFLFGWIPIVNLFVAILSPLYLVIGLKTYHNFSYGRAIASLLIPWVLVTIILIMLVILIIAVVPFDISGLLSKQ